ncbi:MAG: ATP-binding cassette domain-containing protein [Anaerovoracaceae bacterium]
MLQIKNICKTYKTGDFVQKALDGVSLDLRDSEFVAVLGPSGSGKTTFLNVIGGLDRYDSGDLIINGVSTKKYKDRDWDTYRNHVIGFVFQNYNLIPHQDILSNVELALTISGVKSSERKRRAKEALESVGLGDHIHKRPNQLSGGQMQRVAIARALVNDPDILLADEPTGALDSATSVQVMELLKKVAGDRLVIMVTHNPELAERYATRTISLRDGKITGDTDPFTPEEKEAEEAEISGAASGDTSSERSSEKGKAKKRSRKKQRRAKMGFGTSLALSFSNLRTKKARTILTAFAGSIGIIGIALILALSNGVSTYIDDMQTKTMVSYPITIQAENTDFSSMFGSESASSGNSSDHKTNAVYSSTSGMAVTTTNNLKKFKKYLDDPDSSIRKYIGKNGITYSYDIKYDVYTYNKNGVFQSTDTSTQGDYGMNFGVANSCFGLVLTGKDPAKVSPAIKSSYKKMSGSWPSRSTDVVLVTDSNGEIDAETLYRLGFMTKKEYKAIEKKVSKRKNVKQRSYSYSELIGKTYYVVPASSYYKKQSVGGRDIYVSSRDDKTETEKIAKSSKAIKVRICAVIKPKSSDTGNSLISSTIGYTKALQTRIINMTDSSSVVKAQRADKKTNVLTGMSFRGSSSQDSLDSLSYSQTGTASTYEDNLELLGAVDKDDPSMIDIYVDTFDDKNAVADCIAEYNRGQKDKDKISYTDYIKLMMSQMTRMVNIITYVLIAFVALSLIVSSIMIGIITYISVLERTKEIGILRALGASKRNISLVFDAETFIIGLMSGVLGIAIALLLLIPGNKILHSAVGINDINATLEISKALILVGLSVVLTLIGGFIPAKKAARKDPVAALRTE